MDNEWSVFQRRARLDKATMTVHGNNVQCHGQIPVLSLEQLNATESVLVRLYRIAFPKNDAPVDLATGDSVRLCVACRGAWHTQGMSWLAVKKSRNCHSLATDAESSSEIKANSRKLRSLPRSDRWRWCNVSVERWIRVLRVAGSRCNNRRPAVMQVREFSLPCVRQIG